VTFLDPPTGIRVWTESSQSGLVPVGTRQLEIEIDSRRNAFNSSDAYIDNITFSLVPEPSVSLLAGIGGLSLLARRRK
jgi:hypothetical protein